MSATGGQTSIDIEKLTVSVEKTLIHEEEFDKIKEKLFMWLKIESTFAGDDKKERGNVMAIIGIDLGTTNSLAAVWKNGKSVLIPNSFGEYLTPSVVSIEEDGTVLVGQVARERLISHPERTVSSFKRFIGTEKKYTINGESYTPEDLSALVLRKLKEDAEIFLNETVEEAVISVPAYFNDRQRSATKRAGQLAGLVVERLINEPSAAALACRMADDDEDKQFLVFDFGGGTLDVSVVECFDNIVSITAVCGDNHLGGNDFDFEIAKRFCKENEIDMEQLSPQKTAILLRQAEQCKIMLQKQESVLMVMNVEGLLGTMPLSNSKLIKISADLFQKMHRPIRHALADGGLSLEDIDDIILVGGSCKMPSVRRYLSHITRKPPANPTSPDTVVALGAGMYAGMKMRSEDIKDVLLTDICPFTLGTDVYNRSCPSQSLMAPIIERNSVLPTSKSQCFFTSVDGQNKICVGIFQGENRYCQENLKLGEIVIDVPPAPRGEEMIEVRFTYDINGILEVEASSPTTKQVQRTVIIEKGSGLSDDAIQKRLKKLSELKIHPRELEENKLIVARGERLYQETLGGTRAAVGQALDWFQAALASQEDLRIAKEKRRVENFFDQVEEGMDPFDSFLYGTDFDSDGDEWDSI